MKGANYIYILVLSVFISACRDEDSSPLPIDGQSGSSPYLTLQMEETFVNPASLSYASIGGVLTDITGEVESYDINVSLFRESTGVRSDTVFVKRLTSFGEFEVPVREVAAALDSVLTDIKEGDRLDFVCSFSDGSNTWRIDGDEANVNPGLLSSASLPQAFAYSAYIACEINAPFTGAYRLEQTRGAACPFFGDCGFRTGLVDVVATGPLRREWEAGYYSFTVDFNIILSCGGVQVPFTESGIGCGGPGLNWIQDETLGTYNPSNDKMFTINIIDNVDNGCGAGVSPGTVLTMTKVDE